MKILRSNSLPTKLRRPRLHSVYPRRRLFRLLSANENHQTIWITGPAGCGKTTLINSYLNARKHPCLWYSLDEDDADMASFFYHLKLSAREFTFGNKAFPSPFAPDSLTDVALFSKRFFDEYFALFESPFVLVLDDYQQVKAESQLNEVLRNAVLRAPDHIKLFILSRKEPSDESEVMGDRSKVYHLNWNYLKLQQEETFAIAQAFCKEALNDDVAADLQKKTDGWAAGLILLLKIGALENIAPQYLSRQTPQPIFDYLNGEVFKNLSPMIRTQVCRLAFLPRISPANAQKVTRNKEIEIVLRQLYLENAFVNRVKEEGDAYRFHPLMRTFLKMIARKTLAPDDFKMLLDRSALVLFEEKCFEETVDLYLEAENLSAAVGLVISEAPCLAHQGRFGILRRMIAQLPEPVIKDSPWLIYWHAVCELPFITEDHENALQNDRLTMRFIRALEMFEKKEDRVGTYMALAGILESICGKMANFTPLDHWIAKYEELRAKWGSAYSEEVIPWLTPALIFALVMRRPGHPSLSEWVDRGMKIVQKSPTSSAATRIFFPLIFLHIEREQYIAAEKLIGAYQGCVDENGSPLATLGYFSVYAYLCLKTGRFDKCIRIASEAHEIDMKNGVCLKLPQIYGAFAAITMGNMDLAEVILQRIKVSLSEYGHWQTAFYYLLAGRFALIKKDFQRAKLHVMEGLNVLHVSGYLKPLPDVLLFCSIVHHGCGEVDCANMYLKKMSASIQFSHRPQFEFDRRMAEASFALQREDEKEFCLALKEALKIGRRYNVTYEYMTTFCYSPEETAVLCAEALNRGIEIDYVRELIRNCNLAHPMLPRSTARWPWKFKITTLGEFKVVCDDSPLVCGENSSQKPLTVLKYLLSRGGRGVLDVNLQDELWPDTDGDRAGANFKSALYLLRKLLEDKDVVQLSARRLSLNEMLCWTDLWEFDDVCEEALILLSNHSSARKAQDLIRQLVQVYRGPFMPDETAPWAVLMRNRLARRFESIVRRLAHVAETGHMPCL